MEEYIFYRIFSVDLFVSEDIYREKVDEYNKLYNPNDILFDKSRALKSLIFDSLTRVTSPSLRILDLERICDERGKNRIAIVNAHGGIEDGIWCLYDDEKPMPVQKWVDKHDSTEYSAIILDVCNREGHYLTARNTHVFYPDNVLNIRGYTDGVQINIRIAEPKIIPKQGFFKRFAGRAGNSLFSS